jgi:arsenite-transporting ATPase
VRAEAVWRARIRGSFGGAREVLEVPAQLVEPRGTEALLALAGSVRRAAKGPPSAAHPAKAAASRRHRAEPAALPIPATAKLVLVVGKGGVGKTTVAAATALDLAARRPRDRVLVLSTDPAHSLGDALDVALGDAETRLGENLVGRELDAAAAWAAERERYRRSIEDLFASIFRGRMDAAYDRAVLEDLLDLAPPGIDELLAVVTITDALALRSRGHPDGPDRGRHPEGARSAGRYDLVVVDTAPTGHTLRLLALPAMALDWVHAAMEILLKYREVVGLGELAGDLTAFARRLRALLALLADRGKTAFVAVARPAALPRLETARLARELGGLGVPLAAIVANAVSEPTCARCASAAEREEPELERLGAVARRYAASPHLVVAPATYPGPRGAAALERWRATWTQR